MLSAVHRSCAHLALGAVGVKLEVVGQRPGVESNHRRVGIVQSEVVCRRVAGKGGVGGEVEAFQSNAVAAASLPHSHTPTHCLRARRRSPRSCTPENPPRCCRPGPRRRPGGLCSGKTSSRCTGSCPAQERGRGVGGGGGGWGRGPGSGERRGTGSGTAPPMRAWFPRRHPAPLACTRIAPPVTPALFL